jgi:hypothetical protein
MFPRPVSPYVESLCTIYLSYVAYLTKNHSYDRRTAAVLNAIYNQITRAEFIQNTTEGTPCTKSS